MKYDTLDLEIFFNNESKIVDLGEFLYQISINNQRLDLTLYLMEENASIYLLQDSFEIFYIFISDIEEIKVNDNYLKIIKNGKDIVNISYNEKRFSVSCYQ